MKTLDKMKKIKAYDGTEKRRYPRRTFTEEFLFRPATAHQPNDKSETQLAKGRNISQGGILFRALNPPSGNCPVLLMDFNKTRLQHSASFRDGLAAAEGNVLGKVVRTYLDLDSGLFEVGVRFIRSEKQIADELEETLEKFRG